MAYNPSNMGPPSGPYPVNNRVSQGAQLVWKYTTTDTLADVFGHDPITGNPYITGEHRLRSGDFVAVEASDGSVWTISGGDPYSSSGFVDLTRCDP